VLKEAGNQSYSRHQKAILLSAISFQLLITILLIIDRLHGFNAFIDYSTQHTYWKRVWIVLRQMDIQWRIIALVCMVLLLWAAKIGKRWVVPLVLILLTYAFLYLVWDSMPWVWAFDSYFHKSSNVIHALIVLCFFVAIFLKFRIKGRDLANVGIAIAVGAILIYIKGHYSFCCPQWSIDPPNWWAYFDIAGLWESREFGLLVVWLSYILICGFLWLVTKAVVFRKKY
jgi:hypothetical protein